MRYLICVSALLLIMVILGCSKSDIASPPGNPQIPESDSELVMLGAGSMNLETGEIEPLRNPSAYMDITPFVGSNFSFSIEGFYPPDRWTIKLNLNNVSPWTVHDVCIVFEDLYGKTIDRPAGYMDIFQPYDLDPYIGFRQEDPNRTFPPGLDSEYLSLIYPGGASPKVDYFIIAHLGGNTGGVYNFSAHQDDSAGHLYEWGGNSKLVASVYDHQDDITFVAADTRLITGNYTFLSKTADPNMWEAEITNSEGAPAGAYNCIAAATSPSSPKYNTYAKFTIEVLPDPSIMYVDDDNTAGPWDGSEAHPFRYIQDAVDAANDNWTIWVKPGFYYEDSGGPFTSYKAEITISDLNNLTLHGEGMPVVVLHYYDDTEAHSAINAASCDGLIVDGFEFCPASTYEYAVILYSCAGAVVRNCRILPSPATGFRGFLSAEECLGLVVENNSCDDMQVESNINDWGFSLVAINECNNARISMNTFRGMTQSSVPFVEGKNYEYDIFNIGGCDGAEISKNIIGDINWGFNCDENAILQVMDIYFCDSAQCRNNLVYDIHLTDYANKSIVGVQVVSFSDSNSIGIYNNTFDDISFTTSAMGQFSGMWYSGPDSSPVLHSNIITHINAPGGGSGYGLAASSPVTQTYSDVWSISKQRYYWEAIEGVGGIDLDPGFVYPDNDDYHLQFGSPCQNTGQDGFDMGCYGGSDPLP